MHAHRLAAPARLAFACALVLAVTLPGAGQKTSPPQTAAPVSQSSSQGNPTFSSRVKVVNVLATVRDKNGKIVRDMAKEDFNVEEDGHPETIKYFSRETDMPLTLGLLVDTSLSQLRVLGQEKSASYQFLDQMMRPQKDTAFVIHFDYQVELLQDVTSNRQKLQTALDEVEGADRSQRGGNNSGGGGYPGGGGGGGGGRRGSGRGGFGGGGTLLYDGVYLASDEITSKQQGRKALIILTDGVDEGSKLSLSSAIEAAQRADTVVYSILFTDRDENGGLGGNRGGIIFGGPMGGGRRGGGGYPGGNGGQRGGGRGNRPDGKKVLEQLSNETGGRMFEVSNKLSIDQIYAQIEEELRSQYSLGYTPEKTDEATGYRKIQVTTKRKNVTIQARDGYYATP
jgi:VWFA-related protein